MSDRHVTACIDGSAYSEAVCDAAAWASLRLEIGLTFVHVIDKTGRAAESDVSGQIGLGSREHLLSELAQLDEQRARLEREQGRITRVSCAWGAHLTTDGFPAAPHECSLLLNLMSVDGIFQ